jgi:predicted dienelactone hydrolase
MAVHLASYGYIVLSADFPLTNLQAPGGPNYLDVVNQPADVSFLIDRALTLEASESPFEGEIDPERIGVFGISLGGATATLAAFHPEWRDHRVTAAISIAGPGDIFGPRFFDQASVPFLMIAGTSDAIVDYAINAAPIPDRVRDGGLLSIEGGTHAGFTHVTAGFLRVFGNPDNIGCRAVPAGSIPQDQSVFVGLFGTPEQGLVTPPEYRPPCGKTYEKAMRAGRQHMITMLAVRAFFESRFAATRKEREAHETFLKRTLPAELAEVTYAPSRRSASKD